MEVLKNSFSKGSLIALFFAAAVTGLGILALEERHTLLATLVIIFIDAYLALILLLTALKGDVLDKNPEYQFSRLWRLFYPSRLSGILIFILLSHGLVKSFATLYLHIGTAEHFQPAITTAIDATYFSIVTITTLGYGDIHPISDAAKQLVFLEVSSGLLLLFGVFPLLLTRISTHSIRE